MTDNHGSSLERDNQSLRSGEGNPYYLEVIWKKNLDSFPQPTQKQKPGNQEGSSSNPDEKPIIPLRQDSACKETPNVNEASFVYEAALEDLHPYPLPIVPEQVKQAGKEVAKGHNSTYEAFDELWDFPKSDWPEIKREFRVQINWNPLGLRRKTICCLIIFAAAIALIIGMTIALFLSMNRMNEGKTSAHFMYMIWKLVLVVIKVKHERN